MEKLLYPLLSPSGESARLSTAQYHKLYQQSIENPEKFWGEQAKTYLSWIREWDKVVSGDFTSLPVRWFQGGKLNVAYNCLDRHLVTRAAQPAIIWESDDPAISQTITYQDLYNKVCQFANVLKHYGVKKGDRVCIYLPMIPEVAIAMLACARIGAIHSVVFGGFSAEALRTRLQDTECTLMITADTGIRGNKTIPLKQNVDLALTQCPLVKKVLVVKHTKSPVPWDKDRDVCYQEAMASASSDCPIEIMDAEDPLFILYTSGSTGKPKGIVHSTAGYLLHVAMTFHIVFDYRDQEIYWCTADAGWITGHSYGVYGPLANGATTLMFEGIPNYPTPARCWDVIDKHKVNIFYTAPTAIRALRREGDQWVKNTKRASLRLLGSVGEPINPEAWEWYYQVVGESRCPIVDTWWQTETGGIMLTPLPNATPLKPGSAAWPFFGVIPQIIADDGQEVIPGQMGKLVISQPWPGMLQTIYKNSERFESAYFKEFPGKYLTGDQAYSDQDGYFWISGRSDDVLKISGHRIGTQEVESALVSHPAVSEAAVVAIADDIKGSSIYAYVTLKINVIPAENLKNELMQTVRDVIGAIAVPDCIQWADSLPKTRSGKIMRRLLRKIAEHDIDDLGDLSTLADPSVIDHLIKENQHSR